jgi:ABC-type iron transport system FetAB ATPase subunit
LAILNLISSMDSLSWTEAEGGLDRSQVSMVKNVECTPTLVLLEEIVADLTPESSVISPNLLADLYDLYAQRAPI